MIQPLLIIMLCLVLAFVFSEVFRMINLPRVVGQVSAGLLLSIPSLKEILFDRASSDALSFLAHLGIILLFYYVGLETNFKAFTKNLKKSLFISFFNTTIPLFIGFLLMYFLFDMSFLASVIIGICLAVSAQSVSVDILEELKLLRSKIGNIIISAGAVDDVFELLLVSILLSSFHFVINNLTVTRLFIDITIFILFIAAARLWLVPFTLRFFDREHSSTARFMSSMIIVLGIASFSEFLGIGLLIGAMVAGMIVRQTIFKEVNIPNWEEHDIARSTHIISFGFLIPLFFV